ncbi:MAG: signal peptide peptidase SppA [Deltaproteobacteria bacterium]|nr:signal peptide peptidase SppA [Deltaproteobacteria bacterium]
MGRVWKFLLSIPLIFSLSSCTLFEINLGPRYAPLEEQTISGSGPNKILLLDISGVMYFGVVPSPGPWAATQEDMVTRMAEDLDKARQDPGIKGVIIRINSPGGAVTTADLLYHLIREYRLETKTPVVANLMSVAASGGYYAAMAADRIIALPTTSTGSIGVISLKLNLSGLMGRYGVETEAIKSAPLKDMWSPFRPSTDEERRIMQSIIDDLFDRFKTIVKTNRPKLTPEQLTQATTAQVFTAGQALRLGLVDRVGYPEDALAEIKKMAGLEEARLITYHRPGGYRPNIYASGPLTGLDQTRLLELATTPQFMYLWLPGVLP